MKKISILIVFIALLTPVFSQGYFKAGYNLSWYEMPKFNDLLDRYNITRDWLDEQMDPLESMRGLHFGFGVHASDFISLEMTWTGNHNTYTAGGIPLGSTDYAERFLKVRNNLFNFAFLYHIGGLGPIAFGWSFDLGNFKTLTKTNDDNKYEEIESSMILGNSFLARLKVPLGSLGLGVTGYYHLPWLRADFYDTGYVLDKANYTKFPLEDYKQGPVHFGVMLSLYLGGFD